MRNFLGIILKTGQQLRNIIDLTSAAGRRKGVQKVGEDKRKGETEN